MAAAELHGESCGPMAFVAVGFWGREVRHRQQSGKLDCKWAPPRRAVKRWRACVAPREQVSPEAGAGSVAPTAGAPQRFWRALLLCGSALALSVRLPATCMAVSRLPSQKVTRVETLSPASMTARTQQPNMRLRRRRDAAVGMAAPARVADELRRAPGRNRATQTVRTMVLAGTFAAAALTMLGVTIGVLYLLQDRFVYWPSSVQKGTPSKYGMEYEDICFCTLDGVEIYGWFIRQSAERFDRAPVMIYFHGTDKNASFRLRKVAALYRSAQCNILLLSYRGYGESKGRPSERGMCLDALYALRYLRARPDTRSMRTWVYGESLGGAVAVWFAERYQRFLSGLILENTFTSLTDMVKHVHPVLDPLKRLSRNKWLSRERIAKIHLPILFLSGDRDKFVPPVMMRQLYDRASAAIPRRFVSFRGGTHNQTWRGPGFFEAIAEFMAECTPVEDSTVAATDVTH